MRPSGRRSGPGLLLAAVVAMGLSLAAIAADARGYFGFGVKVDGEGIFDTTLTALTVVHVAPGSPAAAAGLVEGDELLEIDGVPVPGSKARAMAAAVHKNVGEHLVLKLKHRGKDVVVVTLVAAAKPG